jgi:hypothetical protein
MPYYDEATRQRVADLVHGLRIVRDAEAPTATGTPGDPFFDVHGLNLVTSLIGICTVTAGGANNMFFRFDPDGTAALADMCATADIGTAAVDGGLCVLVGAAATGLTAATIGSQETSLTAGKGIVCYEGTINLVSSHAVGTWKWVLNYIPLEDGAYIEVIP